MTEQQFAKVLQELSFACKSITSKEQIREVIHKYDMLFGGSNCNIIYSIELYHCIKNVFGIETSLEEVNSMLPAVCAKLNMNCSAMVFVEKLPEHVLAGYQIEL